MEEEDEWKILAFQREYEYFETLGSRHYDEIDKMDLFQLKKKIGFATCGKPSEMPGSTNYNTGYNKEQLRHIKSICDKVVEKSDYNPIRFSCTILILYHKGAVCETPVFRIITKAGNIFIDTHGRVYQNWELFLKTNKLPDCKYCYPLNGEYDANKELVVGFAFSPANSLFNKATDCLDTAGSLAAVAAAGVVAAGMVVTVAPAAISAAGVTAVCTGAYSVTRSVGSLVDRRKHEQSIGLKDQESRSAWLAIGSSAVGMAQMAALRGAQKLVESGRSLSKVGLFGLHALTASSLVFSGFGFVENLYNCADKYNKGNLTKKDVFDLSCELLFFFNAIASARATSQLVNNMNAAVVESASSQKKLTKTQKRNLRKRAAKRRAKGLSVNVTEESKGGSGTTFSATLQVLLFEAVKAYAPRLEEILYTCQSIGHDVMCWRAKEMPDLVLMKNLGRNLLRLYNDFKEEIAEIMTRVAKFFSSTSDDVLQFIYVLLETSLDEIKSFFFTKVINAEDQMELLINEADREITDLYESLDVSCSTENVDIEEECESLDENLSPETQCLLKSTSEVISASQWSCNNLEEFEDIFNGVKLIFISEFKAKIESYKKFLNAAKSASGENFNIETFHEKIGIRGEVSQYMFSETLKDIKAQQSVYKIKSKVKEIKKRKSTSSTPVWEALTEGMFHYYGPHGAGELSKDGLISIVNNIVSCTSDDLKTCLCEGNYTLMEDADVIMISINNQPNLQIVVFCGKIEENTASGMIMVVK